MSEARRSTEEPVAVELSDLSYTYPDGHRALWGVTLRVGSGERVAILGPNGAGKSTLCLLLNGLLKTTSGSVSVCGLSVERDLKEIRRRVGVVFQDPDDMLFMPTVAQDVAFGPSNLGFGEEEVRRRVERALDAVGIAGLGHRPPHHLSFGQKKRAAIAAVLSMQPEVIVLDEPSSGLDPRGRRELGELLAGLDRTLIMTTHDLPYACELCERAVILDGGRVVADGPAQEIICDADLLAAHGLELPRGFVPGKSPR
ncbi:putative ABC transporter ATP-binding protein [Rubrobacter xylanophilus]|uniref:ABC transporter ATP-binding protein n=1 Tax=Rubrobacter xylanophilus TaxID=49319 RepID=A0A510HMC6_9ACTN|nr:ATP-binding cassette domain-containing protein [Rubrobacter xylanophilus]BBL80968.1 putative ABC transporter ATP-binding protein [Rubrobacter xylanophilus]